MPLPHKWPESDLGGFYRTFTCVLQEETHVTTVPVLYKALPANKWL